MKKVFLTAMFFAVTALTANVKAQGKGSVIVDGYYGYGSFYNAVFKALVSGDVLNSEFTGLGPLGVRGEFMISDKVGFGLDIAYNSSAITYSETNSYFDENLNLIEETYDATLKTAKLGIMPTFNFHFVNNETFDAYFIFGIGYGNRTFSAKSDYAGYVSPDYSAPISVASRIGFGMRYYFTQNIGLNFGMGLGQGGLLNGGISARF